MQENCILYICEWVSTIDAEETDETLHQEHAFHFPAVKTVSWPSNFWSLSSIYDRPGLWNGPSCSQIQNSSWYCLVVGGPDTIQPLPKLKYERSPFSSNLCSSQSRRFVYIEQPQSSVIAVDQIVTAFYSEHCAHKLVSHSIFSYTPNLMSSNVHRMLNIITCYRASLTLESEAGKSTTISLSALQS